MQSQTTIRHLTQLFRYLRCIEIGIPTWLVIEGFWRPLQMNLVNHSCNRSSNKDLILRLPDFQNLEKHVFQGGKGANHIGGAGKTFESQILQEGRVDFELTQINSFALYAYSIK